MSRKLAAALTVCAVAAPAAAHHGFGRFDPGTDIELEGTLTGIDFVNPHSYLYFDAVDPTGKVTPMRCEMRAATVLRRSGWSEEMFVPGKHVRITGNPHRDDPASCYIETLDLDDTKLERYQQLTAATQAVPRDRALRLPNGRINLAGDWAQEQYLLARPPEGRGGLVPKSMVEAVESGRISLSAVPSAGWGASPVVLTPEGEAAAEVLRNTPPEETPRARCEITSILFDWVFDGPINRITQTDTTITLEYGRGLTRTIHLDIPGHPRDVAPSRAGHSIGRWQGDTLIVDTVGFEPGSLAGTVPHSDRLHVVERFKLDPETFALRREYVADDARYFVDRYVGADTVLPADAPFVADRCEELTYRNYALEAQP